MRALWGEGHPAPAAGMPCRGLAAARSPAGWRVSGTLPSPGAERRRGLGMKNWVAREERRSRGTPSSVWGAAT